MSTATSPLRARVEQALAFGRSDGWICDHHGVDPDYIADTRRRMDEAALDDEEEEDELLPLYTYQGRRLSSFFGPADPSVIRELIDALCPPQQSRKKAA